MSCNFLLSIQTGNAKSWLVPVSTFESFCFEKKKKKKRKNRHYFIYIYIYLSTKCFHCVPTVIAFYEKIRKIFIWIPLK